MLAGHLAEQPLDLLPGEDHRQTPGALCPHGVDVAEGFFQHIAVKEKQGVEGLILRSRRHPTLDGQVGEVVGDLLVAHVAGVDLILVVVAESDNPVPVGFFGAQGKMAPPANSVDLVLEPGLIVGR